MKTVAFTGHRPKDLAGYAANKYVYFNQQLNGVIYDLYSNGIRRFISGGAQGFDQLAFWRIDCLKISHNDIENIVYVPFRGQEDKWLKDGIFSQTEYNNMLRHADEVKYLIDTKPTYYKDVAEALLSRNRKMVDDAEIVVALYEDDSWRTAKGGTAEAMRYAYDNNKLIYQLPYKKGGWHQLELLKPVMICKTDDPPKQ